MTFVRVVVFLLILLAYAVGGTAATLLVPSDHTTIQSAIDAANAGDEILVSAGTYEEQLVITKNLTLTGAGIDQTVLLAPEIMPHTAYSQNYNAVIHAEMPATVVTLRDFTIEGAGRGQANMRFTGIMYDRAGGTAEQIHIQNFHEDPVSTAVSGIGFYSTSEPGDGLNLLVSDLEITKFQKTGFACFGSGCVQNIRNTVVDASGLYSDAVHNGFELLNGTSGTLSNCTARLVWYDGEPITGTTAVGFLFSFANSWKIEGGLADRCQAGIYGIYANITTEDMAVVCYPQKLEYNYGIVARGLGGGGTHSSPATRSNDKAIGMAQPRPLVESESALLNEFDKAVSLDNCTVTGDKIADSVGLLAFSGLNEMALTLENSTVAGWEIGILSVEEDPGWVSAWARSCRIEDNEVAGIWAATVRSFDARGNNWGDPTGPYHPDINPSGQGDEVVINVVFDPWLVGNVICGPVPQYISQAFADEDGYSRDFVVRYLGGDAESLYGFSIELTWDPAKLSATTDDVSRPDEGSFQAATLFQALPISGGLRVDGALGGDQSGIPAGALFKVRFHLVGEPDYTEIPITVNILNLRDHQNQEILDYAPSDGLVLGDVQAPVFESLKLTNNSLAHTNDFAKNGDLVSVKATIVDDDPIFGMGGVVGNFVLLLGQDYYYFNPDSYLLGDFTWSARPASLAPPDGNVSFIVTATDPAGNTITVASEVTADNTPPQTLSGLVADAGHNQVSLQWDDPSGLDANLRHIVIRSHQTNDYPLYDGPDPGYPISPTGGQAVYTGLGSGTSATYPADGTGRDVINFQAFAVDQVDLISVAGPTSRARATNYLLADVIGGVSGIYDGLVDIYDVTQLGDTFDLPPGAPNFNAESDVGPTDDGTVHGIPEPDGEIDVDDLMIFSAAFGRDSDPVPPEPVFGLGPDLVWRQAAPQVWYLELASPCPILKGLHLSAPLPDGAVVTVTAGQLLQNQTAPYFLYAKPDGLDVSFAVLGTGVGLAGSGELLRIETSATLANLPVTWDARSLNNTRLTRRAKLPTPKSLLPSTFALHGNHPNPFNPATTIVFDLPSPQAVQLVVYGLDGRRVARVLTDQLPAGRQELTWHGRDDQGRIVAAGLYLYRLEAGPWSATGKLNLVK